VKEITLKCFGTLLLFQQSVYILKVIYFILAGSEAELNNKRPQTCLKGVSSKQCAMLDRLEQFIMII